MNALNRFFCLVMLVFSACADPYSPRTSGAPFSDTPAAPDYSSESSWAALPQKIDNADRVPASSGMKDMQQGARADVFFIHPTSYLRHTRKSTGWNADITDEKINTKTDQGSILYQASIFNGAGKIYAPRYRQAFIYTFFTVDKQTAQRALDTAYADVKNAFSYYLDHYNNGRPFIIASHSQGTRHAVRLLKDFLDNDDAISDKLVAAYLVGMPVYEKDFDYLKPCRDADETGCYVSWRTFSDANNRWLKNEGPPYPVCINPLTWNNDTAYASDDLNEGGVLKNFDEIIDHLSDARVNNGVLLVSGSDYAYGKYRYFKNYHVVDYNLFYMNVRRNSINRVRKLTDVRPPHLE